MNPRKFKEQNCTYAVNQPEYIPLPALKINGEVISCWKMSLSEKIRILFTGRVWISLMCFNEPLMPIFLSTKKGDLIK